MLYDKLYHFISHTILIKILILSVVSALHEIINSSKFVHEVLLKFGVVDDKFELAESIISTCSPKHKMLIKTG